MISISPRLPRSSDSYWNVLERLASQASFFADIDVITNLPNIQCAIRLPIHFLRHYWGRSQRPCKRPGDVGH